MRYAVIPPEQFSPDAELHALLKLVPQLDPAVAQAAAWHLANKMSWQELATKQVDHLGGQPPTPYFTSAQILRAQQLIAQVRATVKEQERNQSTAAAPEPTRVQRRPVR
jgi:hypothetical protein